MPTLSMPLASAYEFAVPKGLQVEADRIRHETQLHPVFRRHKQVRKAQLLDLFEERNLLGAFVAERWPRGATAEGRAKRESYNRDRQANERLLNGDSPITDEQREQIIALLAEGKLSRDEIAAQIEVSPGVVDLLKAAVYADEEATETSDATFRIERDLQLALRANIEQLEGGLEIVDGGKENGAIVVIELKAGTAAPGALTQVLAYMGAIAQEEQKPIRGLLIAGGFHSRVTFAARAVPNVQLPAASSSRSKQSSRFGMAHPLRNQSGRCHEQV